MKINRVDPIENISVQTNAGKLDKIGSADNSVSSIAVSQEAKNIAELQRVRDMVLQSPSIRMDRVEEVKAKMTDPAYFDKAIEQTAEKIISAYRL